MKLSIIELNYWVVNNLYKWTMSQKLPVDGFTWVKSIFQFNEDFMKSYSEDSNEAYFSESNVRPSQ